MNGSTPATKSLVSTGAIATVLAVLFQFFPGVPDAVQTFLVNASSEHPAGTIWMIVIFVVVIWQANALKGTYPDEATRPRWVNYIIHLMPTLPGPRT